MLPFLLIALVLLKIKGYSVKVLFRSWALAPFLAVEIAFWILQIRAMAGVEETLFFAPYLKTAFFLSLTVPVFVYGLYKQALIGSGLVLIGSLLNRWVMAENGGKMPVYFTLSHLTGFANVSMFDAPGSMHMAMHADTNLKLLADIVDLGYSVMSIGDLIMKTFFVLVFYKMAVVLQTNEEEM